MQIVSIITLSANLENSPVLHSLFLWHVAWPVMLEKYADGQLRHASVSVVFPAAMPCLPGAQMVGQATASWDCPAGIVRVPYLPLEQALHSLWWVSSL